MQFRLDIMLQVHFLTLACYNRQILLSEVVVIQFLSGVVPLAETAGFTTFLLQLFALRLSTLFDSGHPPSSNQSLLFPCLWCQKKGGGGREFNVYFVNSVLSL